MKRFLAAGLLAFVASGCKSPSASPRVDQIVISAPTLALNVGTTLQLSAEARTSGGERVTGVTIAWSALDPAVAGVDVNGLVTGLAAGTARIVASAAGRSDTVTLTVVAPAAACTPQSAISLAVGATVRLEGAAGGVLCLPGTAGGAEYTIVPFFTSTVQNATLNLRFASSGLVAPTGPPNPSLAPADGSLRVTSSRDPGHAAHAGDGGFHVRLRERSRAELETLVPSARAAYAARRDGARFDVSGASVPSVGDLMTLNANPNEACTNPNNRISQVVAVGQRAIIVADTTNPAGGLTAEDYAHISATMDSLIAPVTFDNFGAPADIDGNQRVIIFYTRVVNELTPASSNFVVGGFFWARDLFPKTAQPGFAACPASNYAEMFYMLAADPTGVVNGNVRSRESIVRSTLGTVGHEMQHLISASRRLYVLNTPNYNEETFLNEGLSHIAEELLFYRASGLGPRANIGLTDLRASQRRLDAVNLFGIQNFGRLRSYLESPESNSPFSPNDDLATRGSAWAFLRYAADRRAGDDRQLWFDLVNNTRRGLDNLQHHLGVDPRSWARDFNVALYADDAVPGISPIHQFPSWNLRTIYPAITDPPRFPIHTRTLANTSLSFSLQASGASYLRAGVPANGTGSVEVTQNGAALPASVSLTVMRTR